MQRQHWLTKLVDPRIDWRLLQAFLDAIESGSFRAAALARPMALNTLRDRIAELERLTGRKLVERKIAGVSPTKDGEVLLGVIRAMLSARDDAIAALLA